MKIEKVDNHKITVTLTFEDLEDFDMSLENLTPESSELHTFLFRIMEQVKLETGFNPYNGQIIVEAKPSNDGVTLVVTKLDGENDKKAKQKIKNIRAKKAPPRTAVYKFQSFDSLCGALARVEQTIISCSSLHKMQGIYYLTVYTDLPYARYNSIISEFCDDFDAPDMFEEILREHGELIAEHENLITMADEIKKLY